MMTRKLWMSLLVASVVALSGCDGGGGVPDGGLVQPDGARLCTGGETRCDGTCVDTSRDEDHCGACGNVCGTAEACVDGACTVVCPGSQTVCDGSCVDVQTDEANCGACGTACDVGETCTAGSCELVCPSTQTECDGACVDTGSDPSNCGACGTTCEAGEVCDMGACALSCSFGLTECDGACVDLDNNPANCGACGFTCDAPDGAIGLCASRRCRTACDGAFLDCNADLGDASGDGCEIDSDTDPDNCGACGIACEAENAIAGCAASSCTIAMCDAGFGDCDMDFSNGCELPVLQDDMNCGACGVACAADELCEAGACAPALAEDCGSAFALSDGANTVMWAANTNDYLTGGVSCSSTSTDGPDLVFSYTAATAVQVAFTVDKPTSQRWHAITSLAACGTTTPEESCDSEFSGAFVELDYVSLTAGQTVYLYLIDSTSGSDPLTNPVTVNVDAVDCSTDPGPVAVDLTPPNGGSTASLSPEFEVTFNRPVTETAGTVTITGDMGTSLSYDLSTSPPEIDFDTTSRVMTIDPAGAFPAGESLTISWTGLTDQLCGNAGTAPTWVVTMPVPSCSPGTGGMVGTTETRIPTGLGSFSEWWVVADDLPTGWVYFGGTTDFYRVPKLGGPVEDVEALASLTSSQLGYEAVVVGAEIYAIESRTTGTTGHVWRISTNGGLTWMLEDYATFPMAPNDDFRGATAIQSLGRMYLVTDDFADTEIWSVPIGGTAPQTATLELTVTGVGNCTGIARDNTYYYLACGTGERLGRVPVGGGAFEDITTMFDMSSSTNDVYGEDLDMDGTFDVLYVQSWYEEIYYVCDPAGAAPYADIMVDVGGSSSNYGMGFDGDSTLYMIDDDNREIIVVQ